MSENTNLSEREIEILRLVATGASNKEIARKLYISTNTVKVHLRNIFAKIGAASRTEATLYAIRERIIPPPGGVLEGGLSSQSADELADSTMGLAQEEGQVVGGKRSVKVNSRGQVWMLTVLILVFVFGYMIWIRRTGSVATPQEATLGSQPRWETHAPLPEPRSNLAAAVYEGEIYAIGGETTTGVTGAVTRYNPLSDTWESLSPKPLPVADIGAAVVGGKIYVPGGRTLSGQPTNDLEIYNPRQDRWEKGASLPFAISGYAIATIEGKIYLFGGWDGKDYLSSVFEYDPEQDVWRERTPMPTARAYAGAAVAGGKIYVVGGFDGKEALAVNEAYSPERSAWVKLSSLSSGRYALGLTSVADIIYMIGGEEGKALLLPPLNYNYQQDKWQEIDPPFLQRWSYIGLVPFQTRVYAFGGLQNDIPTANNLSYQAIYAVTIPIIR